MSNSIILWAYTVLLLAGGLMGFLKAGSRVSLVTSAVFAIPLALTAAGRLPADAAWMVPGILAAVCAWRFAKSRKFMPSGLMLGVSLLVTVIIAVRHFIRPPP